MKIKNWMIGKFTKRNFQLIVKTIDWFPVDFPNKTNPLMEGSLLAAFAEGCQPR